MSHHTRHIMKKKCQHSVPILSTLYVAVCSVSAVPGGDAFVLSGHSPLRVQNEGDGTERLEAGISNSKRVGRASKKNRELHTEVTGHEHSFAMRMKAHEEEEAKLTGQFYSDGPELDEDTTTGDSSDHINFHNESEADRYNRRVFLNAMLSAGPMFGAMHDVSSPPLASALERSYPDELSFINGDSGRDLASIRGERIAERKAQKNKSMKDLTSNPAAIRSPKDLLGSAVWAGALWLLSGSRSNPLVTPLANVLYEENEEQWLRDRNEDLFAPLPPGFLLIMGMVFFILGLIADRSILFLAEGDSSVTLQLAGVALIGGGSLEIGRIASGEKGKTRKDADRDKELETEFSEFAEKKLIAGGNCHRSEVAGAFRRYFAKYRVENDQYPLTDLEIERLMRSWNKMQGNDGMSSAGFFTGVQINQQADLAKL